MQADELYVFDSQTTRWSNVYDAGPTLNQHWVNVLCVLGYLFYFSILVGHKIHCVRHRVKCAAK